MPTFSFQYHQEAIIPQQALCFLISFVCEQHYPLPVDYFLTGLFARDLVKLSLG